MTWGKHMVKICFITYHNWETKRHGGFHQFARFAAEQGHEVVFFSFSRPYYIRFKHEERLNKRVFKELSIGKSYLIGENFLRNVTWPTLALPGVLRKFFPYKINEWLLTHSLTPFSSFKKKWLSDTECFVFESCEAVLLAEKIKREFPYARIIYRPSDPLWEFSNDFFNIKGENEMLQLADRIITVNEESIEGYKYRFPEIFDKSKFICIPNGVNVEDYKKSYDVPVPLRDCASACYIGSFLPDWELLSVTAKALPEIKFVIITPHTLNEDARQIVDSLDNLIYIDGIPSSEVPKWITNCTVVIQPFPRKYGHLNKISLGLTAKNYKAMAAGKPIVTHAIPLNLSRYGLYTSDNTDDFIKGVRQAFDNPKPDYNLFDISTRDWNSLCGHFLKQCVE